MKRALVGLWFAEVEHKPFVNPRWWEKFGLETGEHVTIVNPIDPEARYLRQSLIPGLLQDVKDNRREHEELKLFEWGRVLIPIDGEYLVKKGAKDKLPYQPYHLTFVVAANVTSEAMLRHVKGVMIALLSVAGFTAATVVSRESRPYFIRGSYFDIITGNNVGEGGVASPALRKELDLGERESLGIVTIDITALIQQQKDMLRYRPLPLYPAVRRDVAFVIDDVLPYRAVEEVIARYKQGSLEQFELFDVYQAQGLPHGKKSLAFHLTFRDSERTLTTQEVEGELGRIIRALRDMCGAVIRG